MLGIICAAALDLLLLLCALPWLLWDVEFALSLSTLMA